MFTKPDVIRSKSAKIPADFAAKKEKNNTLT